MLFLMLVVILVAILARILLELLTEDDVTAKARSAIADCDVSVASLKRVAGNIQSNVVHFTCHIRGGSV